MKNPCLKKNKKNHHNNQISVSVPLDTFGNKKTNTNKKKKKLEIKKRPKVKANFLSPKPLYYKNAHKLQRL